MKILRTLSFTKLNIPPLLLGIIAAGIAVRIAGFTTSALWYDETVSVFNVRLPFFTMIQAAKYSNTPPIWEIILWISVHIFGENEFAIRLPSLLVSIFTLWLVYRLTIDFGLSAAQQHLAMLFIALLPFQFWAAQDGRIYAILSALYLAAIWFAIRNRWLGLTACAGLLLYAHFSAPFYLLALYMVSIFNNGISWKSIKYTIISGIIVSVCFIPWVPALILSINTHGKFDALTIYYLLNSFYQALFVNRNVDANDLLTWISLDTIFITWVTALVLGIIFLTRQIVTRQTQSHTLATIGDNRYRYAQLMVFAVVPFGSLIIFSLLSTSNTIYYRPLTAMLMPIIIWVVYTLGKGVTYSIPKYGFIAFWLFLLLVGLAGWSPTSKGSNLREVTSLIYKEWEDGDVIYHITGTSLLPFSYYLPYKSTYLLDEPLHDWLLPSRLADMYGLRRASLESLSYKRVWVIYARDELLSRNARQRASEYIREGTVVGRVTAWHFARIEVYLVTRKIP